MCTKIPKMGPTDIRNNESWMFSENSKFVCHYVIMSLCHKLLATFSSNNVPDPLPRPSCHQIYNMFYPSDPSAVRLEPLLQEKFRYVAPMKVARYEKFPLGDGQSVHVGKNLYLH